MIYSRDVALSCAALSGIVILAIVKKNDSSFSQEKDFISQLPDDLLVSIIERLPTRESIRTSILSKQWRNLYSLVPHVDFDCLQMLGFDPDSGPDHYCDDSYGIQKKIMNGVNTLLRTSLGFEIDTHVPSVPQKKFMKGLDRFLRQHSGSKLVSCQLTCCFSRTIRNKLQHWISSLGRLGVEQLTLKFMCTRFKLPYNYEIPPPFSCELISEAPYLKSLTLVRCTLEPDMKNRCRNLKTLHLDKVTIPYGAMECILSNCSNLESLMIVYCVVRSRKLCICGPNLKLKDLVVLGCHGVSKMVFYASNLSTFQYFSFNLIQFSFNHVPKLKKFSIRLRGENILRMLYAELGIEIPWLMTFLTYKMTEENYREMHTRTGISMFSNLRRLELGFYMFVTDQFSIASVLDLCPLLQELQLVMCHDDVQHRTSGYYIPKRTSKRVKYHKELKKVEFSGFSGTSFETKYALYILRTAMALEQMHISLYYICQLGLGTWTMSRVPWDEDKCKSMHQMFQADAISERAKITISHKQWVDGYFHDTSFFA